MHCTEKQGRVLLAVKARGQNKSKRKSMKSKLGEAWQDRRRRQQGQNQSITPSELARPNWLLLTQVQQWWCLFKIWCFALAMFKSWSKNRHNKHFSLQTHMNGFQQRCLTRKFGNRTMLKASSLENHNLNIDRVKMVENFGEMNLEEQASSLSARGCLWLAVGGRQACEVIHNWVF